MISIVTSLLLAGCMLLSISLYKTYHHISARELRRRAQGGDEVAALFFRVVTYGLSAQLLLIFFIGLLSAGFFVVFSRTVSSGLAFLGCLVLIWFGFGWLQSQRVTRISIRVASWFAPGLAWLLEFTHPALDKLKEFIEKRNSIHLHTGLYQKEDLVDLIEEQQVQADSSITKAELDIALHALTFGDQLVRDVMVPRRMLKLVSAADTIGPILMGELHESGFSRFPVYKENEEEVVGTLYMHDLVSAKQGGKVEDVMRSQVYFVHEEQNLYQALQAFLKTKHHLFLVVNSFEEMVGLLTIEDLLEKIIGQPIVDEFDQYDDLRAVAAKYAAREHQAQKEKEAVKE